MSYAIVTLLNSSSYLPGALVLCHALRDLHPPSTRKADFKLVCIVTPETVDVASIKELRKAFDEVIGVEVITSGSEGAEDLILLGRPDLHSALTKLHIFRLGDRFDKVIYLDADVLPLRPIDHLFFDTHHFAASPDIGWPDCFNSGVMVFKPDVKDFEGMMGLMKAAREGAASASAGAEGLGIGNGNGSFDGADQGLLNEWFSEEGGGGDWHRLSFSYNVTPGAAYSYPPAFKRYGNKIHNIHFIGNNKPWRSISTRPASAPSPHPATLGFDYPSLVDRWFAVYDKHVRPTTDPAVRQTFTVPETQAVWNQPQLAALATPQGRQDLADFARIGSTPKEVRFVVHDPHGATSEGIYSSLPLDGRVDLMRPQPKLVKPDEPAKEAAPSAAASPPIYAQPLPLERPINPPNRQGSPPLAVWDAQRSAPPSRAGPEFTGSFDSYENAWDRSSRDAPKEEWNPTSSYPVIPEHVKQDAWYAGAADVPPDRRNVKAVFPWESDRNRVTARVFPKGDTPPAFEEPLPATTPVAATTEPLASPQSGSSASGSVPAPGPVRHQSFSDAIASYTNAWDEIPSIKRYATRLTGGPAHPTAPPATPGPGTVGLPQSSDVAGGGRPRSRRESSNGKRHFNPPLENRSEDGDVEDTSEDDDRSSGGDETGPQGQGGSKKFDRRGPPGGGAGGAGGASGGGGSGHAHRGSTDATGYSSAGQAKSSGNGGDQTTPSGNRRYRERSAQTDVVQHRDQRTQTGSPKHRPVFFTSDSSSANLTELGRAGSKGMGSPPQYGRTSSTDSVTGHFRKALFANAPQGVTEVMTPSIDDEKVRKFFVMPGGHVAAPSASRTTSDEGFSSSTTVVPSSAATSPSKLPRATRVFDPSTSLDTRKQASLDMLQKFAKHDFR